MTASATTTPPARTYVAQFSTAMAGYVLAAIISLEALNAYPTAPWRAAVALAPVIPAAFGLLAFERFLGRMDEMQRRIQLTAIGFAFGAAFAA